MRRAFARSQPDARPLSAVERQLESLIVVPIAPLRLFFETLLELRPLWPIVLPLLALVAWRTYRRERAEYIVTKRSDA